MSNPEYEKWELGRTPRRYTGLPVEAVRVDDTNADDVVAWIESKGVDASNRDGAVVTGHATADPGEWLVLTDANQLRTMDDNLFNETYDCDPPPLAGA